MKVRTLIGIALVASFMTASGAQARTTVWKSIAMACVPTSTTITGQKYVTTGGRVKHKPGRLGLISFVCPIEADGLTTTKRYELRAYIGRVLNHPLRPSNYVRAQLRGVRNRTGDVFTILDANYGFNLLTTSDRVGQMWSEREYIGWSNEITYYVQLTVTRDQLRRAGGIEQIPSILSVELIED